MIKTMSSFVDIWHILTIFTPQQPLAPCQINDRPFTAPLPDEMQIREGFIRPSCPPNGTMSDA